jgi:hypothetical protein
MRSVVAKTLRRSDSTCTVELGEPHWQHIGVKSGLPVVEGIPLAIELAVTRAGCMVLATTLVSSLVRSHNDAQEPPSN